MQQGNFSIPFPEPGPLFRNHGSFPAGDGLWVFCAALAYFCVPIFLHFVSFRISAADNRLQPFRNFFSDGSSETKWPLGSKRNALPKRAGKPPEGSRRNLRGTGAEKIVGRSGMASGKKTFARRGALRSCTRNSRTRSADQVRQIAASIRVSGFTGPVLFAGGNTIVAGAGPCANGAGDGHGCCALHPAARSPG